MALENRIDALKKQHARLDQMLRAEESRPAVDSSIVQRLKAEKLALKDKIEDLLRGRSMAAA